MFILPKNTVLGYLRYYEIYDEYEGPKCFSVINKLNQLFLVYWSGDFLEPYCSSWLYAPISAKRLDNLRRKNFSLREVFVNPEQCVYSVKIAKEDGESNVELIENTQLENYNLPPTCFYLEPEEIEVIAPEANWNFELKIAKKNNKGASPERGPVTMVIDALSEVIESLMRAHENKLPKLYPISATYGSFEVKLGTSNHEYASIAIEQLNTLLSDVESLDTVLKNLNLDPYRLKDLLDITNQFNLTLELYPKTFEYLKSPIKIGSTNLLEIIKKLESSTNTFIDSYKIPQSNNLDRVIEFVERRLSGEKLIFENVDGLSSERQVQYHLHSARCLGLLNKNNSVTSAGRCLVSKTSQKDRYEFLIDKFESSDFGWAWMKWSRVNDLMLINPDTAEDFVQQCAKGLTTNTSKRRATTLKKWVKLLQEQRKSNESGLPLLDMKDFRLNQTAKYLEKK